MTKRWLLVFSEIAVLATLTLWSGWGALRNPFHFDDVLFLQSAQVTEPAGPIFRLQPTQSRQLTYLTFYWNYQLGGANPFGYHLANLLLHLANALGVYLFASLLLAQAPDAPAERVWPWVPMAAAALFALHPIQSEAVNYAYQRSTLMAAFFSLLSLNAWLISMRAGRPWVFRAAAAAAFVLAVASKESALVLPAIWAAYLWAQTDSWKSFCASLSKSWRMWLPITAAMVLGLAWVLISLRIRGDRTIGLPMTRESFHYFLNQIQVFATYLRMLVLPTGLSADHDFQAAPLLSIYSALCIGLLAGVLLVLYRLRRANSTASFLGLSFLILLAPTSSFVPSADLLFEHRLYLPMIPASVLMVWGGIKLIFAWTGSRWVRQIVWIGCVTFVVTTCTFLFRQRTRIWGDNVGLWEDAASKAPWNARAHYNLGVSLLESNPGGARQAFLRAVELRHDYPAALYNLGWLEQKAGRLGAASEYYRKALDVDPRYWQARQNLGNICVLRGSYRDALREYGEVIRNRPDYWPAYQSLATVQVQLGEFEEALSTLRKLQALKPDSLEVRYLRAYVLVTEGRMAEAESELRFVADRDKDGAYEERLEELEALIQRR